jgi:beta-glucosidase
VDDLICRLTVAEKISQLMVTSPTIPWLRIPEYDCWNEALNDVEQSRTAIVFPQAFKSLPR